MFAKSKPNFSPSDNQANEKLALYVYEYLMHSGARKAAQTFLQEIQWEKNIFLTDRPGFLFSWWSVFWDLYCAAPERRNGMPHSNEARAFHDFGFINPAYSSGAQQTSGFSSGTHQNGQLVQPYLRSGGGGVVSYLASGPQQQQSRPNGSVESLTQQSLNGGCQAGVIMDQRMPYGSSRLATPINQSETKTGMPMFFSNNGIPIHVPISQLEQVYTQGGNAGNQPNFYRNIPSLPISSTPSVTLRHQSMPNTQSPSTVFRPSARPQQVSRMPGGNLNDITLINARTNSIKPGIGTSVAFNYGASQQPQHMTINNYNLQSCNGGGGQSLNSSSSASSFSGSPNNNAEQLQLVAKQKEQIIQTHQAFQRSTQSKSARNVNIYNNFSSVPSQWVTLTQQQEMAKQQQFLDPSFTGAPTMRRENKMLSQSVQSTNNKSSGSLTPPGVDAFPLLFDGGDLNQTYEDDKLFTFYGNSGSNRDSESYVMVSVPNEDFLSNVSASNDLIFSMPSTVSSIEAFDTFPSLLSESMILPVNNFSGLPASSQIGQLLSMSPVPPNPSLHTPTPSVPNSVVYSDLTMHSASHSSVKNEPSQLDESTIMDNSCVDVTNANRKNVCNQSWSQPFRSEEDADTLNSISTGFANDDVNLKNSIFQLNDDEKTVQKMIDSLRENDLENSGLY